MRRTASQSVVRSGEYVALLRRFIDWEIDEKQFQVDYTVMWKDDRDYWDGAPSTVIDDFFFEVDLYRVNAVPEDLEIGEEELHSKDVQTLRSLETGRPLRKWDLP